MLCRVKELTKEAAKRSNCSLSPASHTAATVPRSFETAPDIVPRSMSKLPSAKPSLFHPSNIQLSSTPMKDAAVRRSADDDLNSLLLDGENDLPISGHHLSSGSSTNHDRQLDRISPIHDASKHEENGGGRLETDLKSSGNEAKNVEQEQTKNGVGKSAQDVSDDRQPLTPREDGKKAGVRETEHELAPNDPTSPCSCRSLNSSSVNGKPPPQVDCDCSFLSGSGILGKQLPRTQKFPSVLHLVSSGGDSRQLFAETKARMASARTNISDFLQSEKTRTAGSSRSSKLALINRETGQVPGFNTHLDVSQTHEVWSIDQSVEVLPLEVRTSENAAVSLNEVTCPPADGVVVETASSRCRDALSDSCRQNSGRSWAEILERSSESNRSGGARVTSEPVPDLSCSGDDAVTPEMLDSLKARIKELKRRQEQLELDQLLCTEDHLVTSTTNPFPTTSVQLERDQLLSTQSHPVPSTTNPFPTTSVRSLVTKPGTISGSFSKREDDMSFSAVPASNKDDKVDPIENIDACLCPQYGLQRTLAARSLMFEFTKPPTSSENSNLPVFFTTNTDTSNVASCTTSSGINGHADTAVVASTIYNYCSSLPNSQNLVTSSRSNHLHEIDSYIPAESGTVQRLAGEPLATIVDASAVGGGHPLPSIYSSAVPGNSVPGKPDDNLQTCVSNGIVDPASLIPDTGSANPTSGSANPTTGLSSKQPVSVIFNDDAVMAGGHAHHSVASTAVVSSGGAGIVSTAAVARTNGLFSNSAKHLQPFQFAVTNAATLVGTAAAPLFVGKRLASDCRAVETKSITSDLNSVTNHTQVDCAVTLRSLNQRRVESSVASTSEKATSRLQRTTSIPTPTNPHIGNIDDVGNSVRVVSASSDLPGSTRISDMIQQSNEDKARQQSRSVCKSFTCLCSVILVLFFVDNLLVIFLFYLLTEVP